MASLNILFEVRPYIPGAGRSAIRLASSSADATGTQLDGLQWEPLIVSGPGYSFKYTSDQNGQLVEGSADLGTIQFRMGDFYDNEIWTTYDWNNASCRVWVGELGSSFASYRKLFEATTSGIQRDGVTATVALRSLTGRLKRPLLNAVYAGTGGAEGPVGMKGAVKPIAIGFCRSVEPIIVDAAKWIYQVHGYGPVQDLAAVYDFAQALAAPIASVGTYNELAALTLKPGEWAKCNALGMFRLGGASDKKITADVQGGIFYGQYPHTVADIVPALLRKAEFSAAEIGSFAALANKGWSLYSKEPVDVGTVCRKAVLDAGGYLISDNQGVWQVGNAFSPKALKPLLADGSAEPSVGAIVEQNVADPLWQVEVGYDPCWGVHSASDISPKLLELSGAILTQENAIAEVKIVADHAREKSEEANIAVNVIRKQLPDLVTPLLHKPIDDLSALHIKYGASLSKTQFALHNKNLVAIRELGTRVEEGSKVAEDVLKLTSRLTDAEKAIEGINVDGSIEAGLAEIRRTIVNANYASSEAIDLKIANYGKNVSAWQTEEERVRSEKDSALAEDIETMGVSIRKDVGEDITKLEGSFNDFRKLLVDKDGNITAVRQDELGVKLTETVKDVTTAYEGAIRVVEEARIEDGKATAKSLENLQAAVTVTGPNGQTMTVGSAIKELRQTIADGDGSESQAVINLQSRLDNFEGTNGAKLEQAFRTYANKTDGIGSQYTLKVQTDQNGQRFIAGMGLAIENGVSAIAFSADSFRITTPGQNPQQVFYADTTGIYAPNLTVEKLKANSIDSASLKQAASSKTSYAMLSSDAACSRGVNTTVLSYKFFKEDADSLLKIVMFAQCYHADDFDFWGDILVDGVSHQRAQVRMPFDNSNSRGQAPITPFVFLPNIAAGEHTVSFVMMSNETEGPTYVRAGSTLEVTELRRASIGTSVGSASPVGDGSGGGSSGGGSGGDWGGGGGTYQPEVNAQ